MTSSNVITLTHHTLRTGSRNDAPPVASVSLPPRSQLAGGQSTPEAHVNSDAARPFSFPASELSPLLGSEQCPAGGFLPVTSAGPSFDGPVMRFLMQTLLAVFVGLVLAVSVTHLLPKAANQIHYDLNNSPPYMTGR